MFILRNRLSLLQRYVEHRLEAIGCTGSLSKLQISYAFKRSSEYVHPSSSALYVSISTLAWNTRALPLRSVLTCSFEKIRTNGMLPIPKYPVQLQTHEGIHQFT